MREETRYGYKIEKWEAIKEEMRELIIEHAAKKKSILSYGELLSLLRTEKISPNAPEVGALLGEISEKENAAGRGMLSVLVVHMTGDEMPGGGFFELAKKLGRTETDKVKLWVEEIKKVHSSYS